MAHSDEPLLARDRPPSETSDDRAEEEDNLLTGQPKPQKQQRGWNAWREVAAFTWAVIATAAVIVLAATLQHQQKTVPTEPNGKHGHDEPKGKRNLVFMVSDGMGPVSLSLTRSFRQVAEGNLADENILTLDPQLIGTSRTKSSSSFITDSAAGATAFSCGFKSYNGAISMLPDHTPCGTVLEAAKMAGYKTGLVVTTRITDATPACFASHVHQRGEEDTIAEQLAGIHPLGRMVDLIFGGGRCHFLPNSTEGSCRSDDKNIVEIAKGRGFQYFDDRESFDQLASSDSVPLPILGLFASRDIPYEIDRRNQTDIYPSLDEMARLALRILSDATHDSEKGFFILIEGSRIDHAGHANDPAAQVHEVLAYDKAFASVLEFLNASSTPGVAVSTSDHETGGLATARQLHYDYPEYLWHPSVLANASASCEELTRQLALFDRSEQSKQIHRRWSPTGDRIPQDMSASRRKSRKSRVMHLIQDGLGVSDASEEEIEAINDAKDYLHVQYGLSDLISRRSQNGWSTHGHSAADVNIYASNPALVPQLQGNHENTEVGNFLRDYLDLDLAEVTRKLKDADFYKGKEVSLAHERPPIMPMDHYEGDFRRRYLSHECEGHRH